MFLTQLFDDPTSFIRSLLIMLPGMLLALSLHESAHGYIAHLCGDDTARLSGRITLNPAKHFDPMGFLCMLIIGFGWARPVPVNPNNFRNYRKDDIKVALAGITANLLLFVLCFAIIMCIFSFAVTKVPHYDNIMDYYMSKDAICTVTYQGETMLCTNSLALDAHSMYRFATGLYYYGSAGSRLTVESAVITPVFGSIMGIIYEMLVHCMLINLALAVFNLIPIPPLDGYHVLNDLVLKQDLFAQIKTTRICGGILMALIVIGNYKPEWDVISIVINAVRSFACDNFASLARVIALALGIV